MVWVRRTWCGSSSRSMHSHLLSPNRKRIHLYRCRCKWWCGQTGESHVFRMWNCESQQHISSLSLSLSSRISASTAVCDFVFQHWNAIAADDKCDIENEMKICINSDSEQLSHKLVVQLTGRPSTCCISLECARETSLFHFHAERIARDRISCNFRMARESPAPARLNGVQLISMRRL